MKKINRLSFYHWRSKIKSLNSLTIIVILAIVTVFDIGGARAQGPSGFEWNTFMGSTNNDVGHSLAVDSAGNVYVGGYSNATWGVSPVNPYTGQEDAFIAKFDSSGILQWHTFMGSAVREIGRAIAVDGDGNVYITGIGHGNWGTSPVNPHAGDRDVFVAKLNSQGVLQWNTFMGSGRYDEGFAIAVDGDENIYVVGVSDSTWGASPVNPHAGGLDAFAAKLNSQGVLQWNTFMGSNGTPVNTYDEGHGLTVDTVGNVYVVGFSGLSWGTPMNSHAGGNDVFVTKLNSNGVREWHTFAGSASDDYGKAIALDGEGNIYIGGDSRATWSSPVNAHGGDLDAFTAKLTNSGVLQWNTFMGSPESDSGEAIALDAEGNVYIGGWSTYSSATWGTPAINNHAGGTDAFAAKLNSSGVREWHTFGGSASGDFGVDIALDGDGNAHIAGWSEQSWGEPTHLL